MDRRNFLKTTVSAGLFGLAAKSPIKFGGGYFFSPGINHVVVTGGTPESRYLAAIELLGGIGQFVKKGQRVVLKPSMAYDRPAGFGLTTNPQLVGTIIGQCYKAGAKAVSLFDHTRDPWTKCYKNSGIERIAKDAIARVLPANNEMYYSEVKSGKAKILKSVKINKTLLEADVLINVPALSFDKEGRVAGSLANMAGCAWDMDFIDLNYDVCLPELLYYIKPVLNILDCNIVRSVGDGNLKGEPNSLIISTDCIAADSLACQLINLDAGGVNYLKNAAALGLGAMDVKLSETKKVDLS
jgi:uncharacterized protein (DUF362 family)